MTARAFLSLSVAALLCTGCGDTAARPGNAAQNSTARSGGANDRSATTSPAPRLSSNQDVAADHTVTGRNDSVAGRSDSVAGRSDSVAGRNDATNTRRNRRDRDENALTADNQSEAGDDVQTAAAIRRAITKDDSLSTNAHNIKIIARDGAVTLRGPVDSEDEKTTIVNDAKRLARGAKVVDELEVGDTQLK